MTGGTSDPTTGRPAPEGPWGPTTRVGLPSWDAGGTGDTGDTSGTGGSGPAAPPPTAEDGAGVDPDLRPGSPQTLAATRTSHLPPPPGGPDAWRAPPADAWVPSAVWTPPAADPAAELSDAARPTGTAGPTDAARTPDPARPTEPARPTDELALPRRFVRRFRRGDQREAVIDAARTIEAKVPADFRLAIAAGVLAVAAAIVQQALFPVSALGVAHTLIGYGLALAFLVLAVVAVRSLANELARLSTAKGGRTAAQAIRVTTLLVGYLIVVLVALGLIEVRLGNLLVGGALTGVVLGIAAQQALGNVFAGLVLLFSRPYVPGEQIRVSSGAIGGPHDGVVVSVGLSYTVLLTSYGPLNIPNAQLLASAIGPQPPVEEDDAPAGQVPSPVTPVPD